MFTLNNKDFSDSLQHLVHRLLELGLSLDT